MQVVASEGNANICTLDIYTDGSNVGRHLVKAGEAPTGQWKSIPMIVNITTPQNGEFRMYANQQRTIALDRIYVYSIP
jgi:hypothetical protein